jgi:hypothetical protein
MSRIPAMIVLLLCVYDPAYAAWVPVDCKDRIEEVRQLHRGQGTADIEAAWRDHAVAVRKSPSGSPLYTPHPFPTTNAQIVANFKHVYFERLYAGIPWDKLPAKEQPVYKALKEGRLRFDVVRVENWTLYRCTSKQPDQFYNLLRLFDQTGREVARSVQSSTGLMVLYRNLPQSQSFLPPLDQVSTFLRARFGRAEQVEQAQYVSLDGLPYCRGHRPDAPCVAFKAAGKLYLIDGGRLLYEIVPTAPRQSVTAFRAAQRAAGPPPLGFTEFDAPMVTLGFEWAKARLVGGQKPK